MPPVVLSPLETDAAMKAASSELKYLFAKEGISLPIQAQFYHAGVVSIARFSTFCRTDDELRDVVKSEMGLDAATSLAARTEVSGIVCAFRTASARSTELAKHEGEMEARKIMKPLLNSEYLIMKAGYEAVHGRLEDCELPAKVYLERRIAELESGELRAESLQSVLNREQDGEETLLPQWDISGEVRLKRSVANIEEPANPEELRRRLGTMFVGLSFIGLQHTNRAELQGIGPPSAQVYAQFLLGEHVWMLLAKDGDGKPVATPAWGLVLKYEFAIRRRAYKEMQETGRNFMVCLKESWLDPLTRERNFVTPMAIAAATGRSNIDMTSYQPQTSTGNTNVRTNHLKHDNNGRQGRGRGNGRGHAGNGTSGRGKGQKGRGKGKGQKGGSGLTVPTGCAARTPDGAPLCFAYNDQNTKCKVKDCYFKHLCGLCFEKHPMYTCRGNRGSAPSETQGAGQV
jgi:hypothetical protein